MEKKARQPLGEGEGGCRAKKVHRDVWGEGGLAPVLCLRN